MKAGEPATLLLVDDERMLLEVCQEAFTQEGYTVFTADNGDAALGILSRHPVDCVITDMRMPVLDGLGLIERLTRLADRPAVIVLTGYGTISNAVECVRMGAADYLLKPFRINELLDKVRDVLCNGNGSHGSAADADSRRMSELLEAGRSMAAQPDIASVATVLLASARSIFGPDCARLQLCGAPGRPDVVHEDCGEGKGSIFALPQMQRLLSSVSSALVDGRREAVLWPRNGNGNGNGSKTDSASGNGNGSGMGSLLAVPLVCGTSRPGVLILHRRSQRPGFDERDLHQLSILGAQAGATLERLMASRRLTDIGFEVITSYVRAVEAKDYYTRGHSERVCSYAMTLGLAMGLSDMDLDVLKQASMLHDIGKIGIPDQVLNKPGPLNPAEWQIMRRHPVIGQEILSRVSALAPVLPIVYHHHERYDGCGYPDGLAGQEIPLLARVISVVDSFEAITSERAYKSARSVDEAVAILSRHAGTQWDPDVVSAWLGVVKQNGAELVLPSCPMHGQAADAALASTDLISGN